MDSSDLGLVYSSTTGLELALYGVPVIAAARIHYADKGFTIDAVRARTTVRNDRRGPRRSRRA